MTQLHNEIKIQRLGSRSALACLSLAVRTFGIDSPQYRAIKFFNSQRRAGYIATIRNRAVGFVVYDNRSYEQAEVLAFAVERSSRKQGIGRRLMERVTQLPRKVVTIRVIETSLETQLFLRSQGFRAIKIEHTEPLNYYIFQKVMDSRTDAKHGVSFPNLQHPQNHVQTNHQS